MSAPIPIPGRGTPEEEQLPYVDLDELVPILHPWAAFTPRSKNNMPFSDAILAAAGNYPIPQGLVYSYGTAGFRMHADSLPHVAFIVGVLAALRSRKFGGQTVGVMITASHNPPEDNGVKIVDPSGGMMETEWEAIAATLANAKGQDLAKEYQSVVKHYNIDENKPARVIFGRDTRASGSTLVAALVDGLNFSKAKYEDFKLTTTPQLHYLVRCINTQDTPDVYGEPTETGYYEKLAAAFKKALGSKKPVGGLTVDCANGVGAPKLEELMKYLGGLLDITVVNKDIHKPDMLNVQCGADFVKTQQRAPPSSKAGPGDRCCSLDGDADRLIYYFSDKSKFCLLDGDRIAILAVVFLRDLLKSAGLSDDLRLAIVQTAYANGASTSYVKDTLKLEVVCAKTGVKHLHSLAHMYDVGVYFEANGHGTVLFSDALRSAIASHKPASPAQQAALATLQAMTELINQTVGDALSDMLMVEVILAHKHWSPADWFAQYTDLPNRLVKVAVADRGAFQTFDAERKLSAPAGAQDRIDAAVRQYNAGRAFARASGTEDAVRVYAEARTRGEADALAAAVVAVVEEAGK